MQTIPTTVAPQQPQRLPARPSALPVNVVQPITRRRFSREKRPENARFPARPAGARPVYGDVQTLSRILKFQRNSLI
jgi:hypothetical protein